MIFIFLLLILPFSLCSASTFPLVLETFNFAPTFALINPFILPFDIILLILCIPELAFLIFLNLSRPVFTNEDLFSFPLNQ